MKQFCFRGISDDGLRFLRHISPGEKISPGFWNWVDRCCYIEQTNRAAGVDTSMDPEVRFPSLPAKDLELAFSELTLLAFRIKRSRDAELVRMVTQLTAASRQLVREHVSLN